MARYNIVAGSSDDISLDSIEWLIIDIGYARKRPTNAIWRSNETLGSFYFGQVKPSSSKRPVSTPTNHCTWPSKPRFQQLSTATANPPLASAMNGQNPTQPSPILDFV